MFPRASEFSQTSINGVTRLDHDETQKTHVASVVLLSVESLQSASSPIKPHIPATSYS